MLMWLRAGLVRRSWRASLAAVGQRVRSVVVPGTSSRRGRSAGIALAIVILLVGGAYFAFRHVAPLLAPSSGCEVRTHGQVFKLDPGQAGIAATIAGVARQHALPARAVTVAYAAALQESKLQNLRFGDRDSVGVFQQRPSEGWGSTRQLEDPVYATTKFFQALAQVPRYRQIPVYKAAQAVQRSADGSAYIQYQQMAASMSQGFTGHAPRSVWCWYGGKAKRTGPPHRRQPEPDPGVRAAAGAHVRGSEPDRGRCAPGRMLVDSRLAGVACGALPDPRGAVRPLRVARSQRRQRLDPEHFMRRRPEASGLS